MLAQRTSAALSQRGIHHGWIVAAVTFLAMLTTSAALGCPGAMLQPLSREFGWSADQQGGPAIFLPAAAWLIAHHGWRYAVLPVVLACAMVAILALMLMRDRPRELGLQAYGEPLDAAPKAHSAPAH